MMNRDKIEIDKEEAEYAKIIALIEGRDDFKQTLNEGKDEEFVHAYNAIPMHDVIVVMCWFENHMETQRQYLIYEDDVLRESTNAEDDILRFWDDELPLLEHSRAEFLMERNVDNSISRRGAK